jgi:AAA15 family ATPase/GTPase
MKIKSIYVNNFKSLVDFKIDLADFNCLIGLNGSGKSTFLQFVSFLSQLMKGNIAGWLRHRGWKRKNIISSVYNIKKFLSFEIIFLNDNGSECTWKSKFNVQDGQCLGEFFSIDDYVFKTYKLKNSAQRFYWVKDNNRGSASQYRINFQYTGSIFSVLNDFEVPNVFYDFCDYIKTIETVDLLAPQFLRRRSYESHGSIGPGGKYLSALLYELGKEKNKTITDLLKTIYPTLIGIEAKQLRAGCKQLEIEEQFQSIENRKLFNRIKTKSKHINDGLLRMIGFLSQLKMDNKFLLFDEIENGMNTEVIGFLLNQLLTSGKQIVVTTHSPMILNYLDDKTAIPGIHFFYKTPEGNTQCVPFLSIPSMREKLEVMGPGEALIDTNLFELSQSLVKNNIVERKEA